MRRALCKPPEFVRRPVAGGTPEVSLLSETVGRRMPVGLRMIVSAQHGNSCDSKSSSRASMRTTLNLLCAVVLRGKNRVILRTFQGTLLNGIASISRRPFDFVRPCFL